MRIFLVQHGQAKSADEDPKRPLSDEGRENAQRVAEWAKNKGLFVVEIRHSGKKRAEETAIIFGNSLHPVDGVKEVTGLLPNDDVLQVGDDLEVEKKSVMLVGHLPFMSRLASMLLVKNPDQSVISFQNAGLVGLEYQTGQWSVSLVVTPDVV